MLLAFLAWGGAQGCASLGPQELTPFTSDGCSSFPDGTREEPDRWKSCCVDHDRAYWLGGTRDERRRADDELHACIERIGGVSLARAMWLGVRAGGGPYWPTKYRWAYGWPFTRGYRAVTEDEVQRARSLLASEPAPQRTAALEAQ